MWPRYPSIFEINTWVWLTDLGRKYGRPVDLASVPAEEWNAIGAFGFDAVWLMGVWERSGAGIAIANETPGLLDDFRSALPDFRPVDNVGSPYCIRRYVVDAHLGGPEGLAEARRQLAQRGIRLVLDFVPNHVAPDHPWVAEHPEYFVRGTPDDVRSFPESYRLLDGGAFACGRDPYFPAWPDVLQLNAFNPGLRDAVIETILEIAGQSDGVRCDMAMLLLNDVFAKTWAGRAGKTPPTEYWVDVISGVKRQQNDFLFVAEAYWDLEWDLQQKGFHFCYDKRLYDRLAQDNAENVRLHLCADRSYQDKLVRFIENHDEPRAAEVFGVVKSRAAAVVAATLPGARLFHEGQFEGRKVHLPVFLGRRPEEAVDEGLRAFYGTLLAAINYPVFREGSWELCDRTGWPNNPSYQNVVAWSWTLGEERYLVAVNLSDASAQAMVRVKWSELAGGACNWTDKLSGKTYSRAADEFLTCGLYVDLGPWSSHLFQCKRAPIRRKKQRESWVHQ
jgi:glycosidase